MEGGKREEATSSESKPRHEQLMKDTACTEVLAMVKSLSRAAAAPPPPSERERESTEPLLGRGFKSAIKIYIM